VARRQAELTAAMNAFRGMLGIKVVLCRLADPEAKGLVERCDVGAEQPEAVPRPQRRTVREQ
jgi:hypothetical protein